MDEKGKNIKAPRFVQIKKGDKGYGFNLHGERGVVGQYISAVDNEGPAQLAGLCVGDRVVEVNGVNVEAATHSQVVAKIKESVNETSLLVVDKVTDDYLKQHNMRVTVEMASLETVVKNEPEETEKTTKSEEDAEKATEQHESKTGDDEVEEVGMSIEDYLKMHSSEDEGKPAEIIVEVTSEDNAPKEEVLIQETMKDVSETPESGAENQVAETAGEEASSTSVPEQKQAESNVKMTPPEQPPPAPPVEQAKPEPAVQEPPKESEPIKESEVPKEPELPEEPEPPREPEPVAVPEPQKHVDPILKKNAALPKPKRKEIKEKKGTDWAARAAIFNNL
ncbi:Na(+)/H(+) exchange regulatory cofactor NHE-RF1-like [Rhopilema esculentum]|uniref:Na(+)/H(+) exchange regulatory cofactor NHE-RF1-like n=1 Tax=Rhopilema esculentum TaxID=499914 RepID=UPI0031DD4E76|eukprot:gene13056-3832_t